MSYLRFCLFPILFVSLFTLSGCASRGKTSQGVNANPKGPEIVVRDVICDTGSHAMVPQLEPLAFSTVEDPQTRTQLICLTPIEHTIFQTNHVRLIGYIEELKTHNRYLETCIQRHNQQARKDSSSRPVDSNKR
jgi:hypothetical protein